MDERTRGFIESSLDRHMEANILNSIEWVKSEMPISSLRDLSLGYFIGAIEATAISAVVFLENKPFSDEDKRAIKKILKRRLPEIVDKINRELNV